MFIENIPKLLNSKPIIKAFQISFSSKYYFRNWFSKIVKLHLYIKKVWHSTKWYWIPWLFVNSKKINFLTKAPQLLKNPRNFKNLKFTTNKPMYNQFRLFESSYRARKSSRNKGTWVNILRHTVWNFC